MTTTILRWIKKFFFFAIVLVILYFFWLPFSIPYQWLRLKVSYLLLNLMGFYPKFVPPGHYVWLGEYFSFLPYLALMITTYQKKTVLHVKKILIVLFVLITLETMGRFFSELAVFYPASQFITPIAIFLLATARPAVPFFFWLLEILSERPTAE